MCKRKHTTGCEGFFYVLSECARLGKKDYKHFVELGRKSVWYHSTCKLVVHSTIEVKIDANSKKVEVVVSDLYTVQSPALSVALDGTRLVTFSSNHAISKGFSGSTNK